MIAFAVILMVSLAAFFVVYNTLSAGFAQRRKKLAEEHRKVMEQLRRLDAERKELSKELAETERELERTRKGLKTVILPPEQTAGPDKPEKADPDTDVANYLIKNGHITMEQHEKALAARSTMQLDLASVCVTLGFIDAATAKKATAQAG